MFDSKLNDSNRDVDVDIPFSDLAISNMNTEDNLTEILRMSNKKSSDCVRKMIRSVT